MEVPDHLKDSHYPGAKKLGHGKDYKYPHDYGGYVEQDYLKIKKKYYLPE
jgi:putative ATPase